MMTPIRARSNSAIVLAALFIFLTACGGPGSSGNDAAGGSQYNVKLSSLTPSQGTLSPTFDPNAGVYTVEVASTVETISVTPAAANANAIIRVNNSVVASGNASPAVSLAVGQTAVAVIVTAPDESASKTYLVMVNRLAAPSGNANLAGLALSSGAITPAFNPSTTWYNAEVTDAVSEITVSPTAAGTGASITVNGYDVASGGSKGITLVTGNNTITTVVKSENGTAEKTYALTVRKLAPSVVSHNAFMSNAVFSTGVLQPAFSPDVCEYTLYIPEETESFTVTPFVSGNEATVKINGQAVASGNASQTISKPLAGWENVGLSIVATAGDGVSTKTYNISYEFYEENGNTNLSSLAISSGVLNQNAGGVSVNNSVEVVNAVTSITLTAVTFSEQAEMYINGIKTLSGVSSDPVSLAVGVTTVKIIVVNGVNAKVYQVNVTRLAGPGTSAGLSNLVPSRGELVQNFNSEVLDYNMVVPYQMSSIMLMPSLLLDDATVTVNGEQVTPGSPSQDVDLAVGDTTIPIVVTAGDGTTTRNYSVKIHRLPDLRIIIVGGWYWENGVIKIVDDQLNAGQYFESVVIYGNDVHLGGYILYRNQDEGNACYALNNSISYLDSSGSSYSRANSIFVSSGDVYLAGYASNLSMFCDEAVFWKNGVYSLLSYRGFATSIFVAGDDVYMAGYNDDIGSGYWKNGSFNVLDSAYYVNSICVSGFDVYVAGNGYSSGPYAAYWLNGTENALTDGSLSAAANSIVVSGTDVYVAGYEGNYAKYWLNGSPVNLTDGTQEARANQIFFYGSDVYVVGKEGDYAMLWKIGVGMPIAQGEAKSIFVAP